MKQKGIMAFILTIIMLISMMSNVFAEQLPQKGFTDIEGHWAKEKIERLVSFGVLNSSIDKVNVFQPEKKFTRAETIELVLKANLPNNLLQAELNEVATTNSFSDTKNHRLKNYIELSKKFGIVVGYNDGTFKPDGLITREEFAAILVRSQEVIEKIAFEKQLSTSFRDVGQERWSYNYIAIAAKAGLVSGYLDKTFKPKNDITRAEAYTMVDNYYNACFVDFKGIVGFASIDGRLSSVVSARLIDLRDGKMVQTVLTNKYGQYRFDISDKNDFRIELNSGDMLGIIPKVSFPLKAALINNTLALEKTIQVEGTAYDINSVGLNNCELLFQSGDLKFSTITNTSGQFNIMLLPRRTYTAYKLVNGVMSQIGEVGLGTIAIANLIFKPEPILPASNSPSDSGNNYSSGDNNGGGWIQPQTVYVRGVSLTPTSAAVLVGRTTSLIAAVTPLNATNKNVTWVSNNTSVATVDANGIVTGHSAGIAIITVITQDGGFTSASTITVNSAPITVTVSVVFNFSPVGDRVLTIAVDGVSVSGTIEVDGFTMKVINGRAIAPNAATEVSSGKTFKLTVDANVYTNTVE